MDNLQTKNATKELPDGYHAHKVCIVNPDGTWPAPGGSTVAVSNFPATQPVSLAAVPAHDVNVTNFPSGFMVAVSNFPATQPVSGTVAVSNLPATQPVSAAALPLPSGASTEATLAALNAKVTTVNTGAVVLNNAAAVAKGAQGTNAIPTQDMKDSGRVRITLFATGVAAGATGVETMINLTRSADQGANSSASSFVITNGKKFRIESITFCTRGHNTATAQVTTFSLRTAAGTVTTGSTVVLMAARCGTPATANAWDRNTIVFPDGYEITGDGVQQIGVSANSVFVTNAPTWDVMITGYEY